MHSSSRLFDSAEHEAADDVEDRTFVIIRNAKERSRWNIRAGMIDDASKNAITKRKSLLLLRDYLVRLRLHPELVNRRAAKGRLWAGIARFCA